MAAASPELATEPVDTPAGPSTRNLMHIAFIYVIQIMH